MKGGRGVMKKDKGKIDINWRKTTLMEKILLCNSIRKNNIKCIFRAVIYTIIPCSVAALEAFFIYWVAAVIIGGVYVAGILVYGLVLDNKCWKIFFGKIKCADAFCFGRDEEYQYTINGFSYYIKVFRLCSNNEKRIFKLPAYKNTIMYSNSGDNMLAVRFSKNDIRCFSKKELGLTSHNSKSGSWSKLDKNEVDYILKIERAKLKEARSQLGVNFFVLAAISVYILFNYHVLFRYSIMIMALVMLFNYLKVKKRFSRVQKLKKSKVNALKNAVVSCFLIRKPSGRGGYHFIYYFKIMHPETGKFRIEKLRKYTWVSCFDNEVSDNIIVVDYGKKRRGRNMQHYILEEY